MDNKSPAHGKGLMMDLRTIASAIAQYRNDTIPEDVKLRDDITVQLNKIRDATLELEKLFGLRQTSVKLGDLTVRQITKICRRANGCDDCPFFERDETTGAIRQYCKPTDFTIGPGSSFDPNKSICVYEEDLR